MSFVLFLTVLVLRTGYLEHSKNEAERSPVRPSILPSLIPTLQKKTDAYLPFHRLCYPFPFVRHFGLFTIQGEISNFCNIHVRSTKRSIRSHFLPGILRSIKGHLCLPWRLWRPSRRQWDTACTRCPYGQ